MNHFLQFQKAISIEQKSDNLFEFTPDKKYSVGATPNGGYLAAVMHKALVSVLPHSCSINSNVWYLDRTDHQPVDIKVTPIRISKGTSVGDVELIQGDKITCKMTGICTDLDKLSGYSDLQTPLPRIFHQSNHDSYVPMNYDSLQKGFTPEFVKQLSLSVHPDHVWWSRNSHGEGCDARCSGFVELEGDLPDQFALSYLADILPPVVTNKYGPLGWIPTLTLTTSIKQLPSTQKVFIDAIATDLNKGYFEQNLSMWDLNENLVATSRQIAKVLKSNERLGKN